MEELELKIEELKLEELEKPKEKILKVFIYNTKGEKIKEEPYSLFVDAYDFVLEHNAEKPEDPYNLYPGTDFPPKGYKWSEKVNDWIEITLFEKWQRGEVDIPIDCKIVNEFVVRKNLQDLYEEGLLKIPNNKKIDSELDVIVDKDEQELIDEGLLNWDDIYKKLYNEFKIKIDHYLDAYYFKYPKNILVHFKEKTEIAKKWINLSEDEKEKEKRNNFFNFLLLISEFKNKNDYLTLDDVHIKLDELCKKIIEKNNEIETKIGSINNFFNQLHSEIEIIKQKKQYYVLLDFVHQIDNRIIQWIKS